MLPRNQAPRSGPKRAGRPPPEPYANLAAWVTTSVLATTVAVGLAYLGRLLVQVELSWSPRVWGLHTLRLGVALGSVMWRMTRPNLSALPRLIGHVCASDAPCTDMVWHPDDKAESSG